MKRNTEQKLMITLTKKECEIISANFDYKELQDTELPIQTKLLLKYIKDFTEE